jgi:hypothetical protein
MHAKAASSLPVLLLACALTSQTQTVVSPLPATASVEGTMANGYPFASYLSARYMQVHSDVGGTPKLIKQIAFRRDGARPATGTGTRAVDCEFWLGHSVDWNRISFVFANNWLSTPTQVITRQVVNIGPLLSTNTPAPFELVFPFGTPFLYIGNTSLAWDSIEYANTGTVSFSHDAEGGTSTNGAAAVLTGAGCVATSQTVAMDIAVQHVDRGGSYQCGLYVQYAPTNAPTVLMLGTANPALTLPGLCGGIYTNFALQVPLGVSSATGFIGETGVSASGAYPSALATFVLPNTFNGAAIYAQAHALDAGSSLSIPVCNSNGRSWTVPAPNTGSIVKASRLYSFMLANPTYPNATPLTLSHGYAAVVELTY